MPSNGRLGGELLLRLEQRVHLTVGRRERGEAASETQRARHPAHHHDRGAAEPARAGTARPAADLVLKREQRQLEQILVRIVERHPALELRPTATHDAQPIASYGGSPGIGLAGTRARAMGQTLLTRSALTCSSADLHVGAQAAEKAKAGQA